MKIELKKIKFSESLSEETNAFTADIYVNGKNVGYCKNDGHGGSTFYHANSLSTKIILQNAEKYCQSMPPLITSYGKLDMSLELMIDELFDKWLKAKDDAKFQKSLKKDMLKGLCLKTHNGYEIKTWSSNGKKIDLETMLFTTSRRNIVKKAIEEAKLEGREILNTNLPKDLVD